MRGLKKIYILSLFHLFGFNVNSQTMVVRNNTPFFGEILVTFWDLNSGVFTQQAFYVPASSILGIPHPAGAGTRAHYVGAELIAVDQNLAVHPFQFPYESQLATNMGAVFYGTVLMSQPHSITSNNCDWTESYTLTSPPEYEVSLVLD